MRPSSPSRRPDTSAGSQRRGAWAPCDANSSSLAATSALPGQYRATPTTRRPVPSRPKVPSRDSMQTFAPSLQVAQRADVARDESTTSRVSRPHSRATARTSMTRTGVSPRTSTNLEGAPDATPTRPRTSTASARSIQARQAPRRRANVASSSSACADMLQVIPGTAPSLRKVELLCLVAARHVSGADLEEAAGHLGEPAHVESLRGQQ